MNPMNLRYRSRKTYGHNLGFSCVFRQHKADSHCNKLHGYSLEFSLVFGADELDERGWVLDFGGLKPVKEWLTHMFDHTLLVAKDDPRLKELDKLGMELAVPEFNRSNPFTYAPIADIRKVPAVGCEAFAKIVFDYVDNWLIKAHHSPRVKLLEVAVREHGANEASVIEGLS